MEKAALYLRFAKNPKPETTPIYGRTPATFRGMR